MNIWSLTWGSPENLVYAPLFIFACCLIVFRVVRWQKSIRLLAATSHFDKVVRNASLGKQIGKALLLCVGLLFLLLALLRPQWDKKEMVIAQEGRDLFIALDVSRSMLAQDCKPNRLACAKQKIKALLQQLSSERVGLILFSGSTFVQCPLTSDYGAFYMFLDQIGVETISSGTTAIDQAIMEAVRAFKASGERKNKLLIMVTDGEDFSSNLSGVKQEAAQEGMKIFTLGVGTAQGAPIPLFDDTGKQIGHQLDNKGAVVISRLNEGILKSLAHDCGGIYISMTEDDTDVNQVLKYVQRFEKEKIDDKKVSMFQEQYPYFVAVSFACLAIEWLL